MFENIFSGYGKSSDVEISYLVLPIGNHVRIFYKRLTHTFPLKKTLRGNGKDSEFCRNVCINETVLKRFVKKTVKKTLY